MSLGERLHALDRLQQRHRWLAFAAAVIKKFGDDEAGSMAALIAYYGFVSLFPLLLVLVTVLGFVLEGDPKTQAEVLHSTLSQFPIIGDSAAEQRPFAERQRAARWRSASSGCCWAAWASSAPRRTRSSRSGTYRASAVRTS